jgi:hypothetical protein
MDTRVENAAKIAKFLYDSKPLWRTQAAIQKATGLVDHEWNEATAFMFELKVAHVPRCKHSPIIVYQMPDKDVDMFGNAL